jgi:flagellar M-ring protein FliF
VREQRSEESNQPGGGAAGGVPGATSNQPQTPPTAPINGPAQALQTAQAGAAAGTARREAATRFEVDKTVTVTKSAMGSVRRLSAAVVVNHRVGTDRKGKSTSTPLSEQEIEQLTALVQQGIGFNAERGDVVRVVNAPFRVENLPPVEELPLWKQPWVIDLARSAAAPAALALVACVIVFSLIRPAMTAVMTPRPAPPGSQLAATVGDDAALPGLAEQRPDALALGSPRPNERLDAVRHLARENPSAVAQIVRGWVNGEPA